MSIERADNVLAPPERITNMADIRAADLLPPPLVYVPCPPGYTHGAPDTHTPYETGPKSLPQEDGDAQR
jgi:hypothetical protein